MGNGPPVISAVVVKGKGNAVRRPVVVDRLAAEKKQQKKGGGGRGGMYFNWRQRRALHPPLNGRHPDRLVPEGDVVGACLDKEIGQGEWRQDRAMATRQFQLAPSDQARPS